MDKFFEVANHEEAEIFAFEELRAEIQLEIQKCLVDSGVSRRDLAKRMECSPAWVTQALGDDANLTLESVSKIFLALGRRCALRSEPLDFHVEGYDDCDAITNDDDWRVSSPEKWHMEVPAPKVESRSTKKIDEVVVHLMHYRENGKRSSFKRDAITRTETNVESSLATADAYAYAGK